MLERKRTLARRLGVGVGGLVLGMFVARGTFAEQTHFAPHPPPIVKGWHEPTFHAPPHPVAVVKPHAAHKPHPALNPFAPSGKTHKPHPALNPFAPPKHNK